jgi:hypothetical protein
MPSTLSLHGHQTGDSDAIRRRLHLQPWFTATFLLLLPFAISLWLALLFPAQASLLKNMVQSALNGDARYWSAGQWRADARTLDAARRWMLDVRSPLPLEAGQGAPVILVGTNSHLIKPTV